MKLRYTPAAVFLSLIPCVSIAQDAEVLQSAILKGCGLDELEKLIQGGVSVHTEIALFPGQEPAPLICVLLSEEYQNSSQVPHVCSHEEMALFLIRMGADVNAKDKQGRTPLHLCGLDVVFHILVEAGADINAIDNAGNKPQIRARMEGAPLEDDDRSPEEIREEGVCYAEGKKVTRKTSKKPLNFICKPQPWVILPPSAGWAGVTAKAEVLKKMSNRPISGSAKRHSKVMRRHTMP